MIDNRTIVGGNITMSILFKTAYLTYEITEDGYGVRFRALEVLSALFA